MTAGAAGCEENEGPIIHGPVLQGIFRHCEEPTGPALMGRPDDRLRDEAIHGTASGKMDCFASLAMTRVAMTSPNLFVYGTLMRGYEHPMARLLSANAEYLGEATCRGRLYMV